MKDTKLTRIKMIFVVVITILVVFYVYFVAPYFLKDIDALRTENKQIEHDLSQIKAMGTDLSVVREEIENSQNELEDYEKNTKVNSENFDMEISKIGEDSDVSITEIAVEDTTPVGEENVMGQKLYCQSVAVSFSGGFKEGIKFIENLEKSSVGVYKVNDFLYTKAEDEDEKMWMVGAEVYYYEDSEKK